MSHGVVSVGLPMCVLGESGAESQCLNPPYRKGGCAVACVSRFRCVRSVVVMMGCRHACGRAACASRMSAAVIEGCAAMVAAMYSAATLVLCVVVVLCHCIDLVSGSVSSVISFHVAESCRYVCRCVSSVVVRKYVDGSVFHHPGVPSVWSVLPSVSCSVRLIFSAVWCEHVVSVCRRCDWVSSTFSIFAQSGHFGLYSA